MAGPTNTPVTASIGHLSVEDLFAPLSEKSRLGGPGPFVINLAVSAAPLDLPPKNFDLGRDAYVYQVQRTEDRRLRYRLRLGTFANEDAADIVLKRVRNTYPAALTATADADDQRAIAALQSKTGAQRARAAAKAVELAVAQKDAPPAALVQRAASSVPPAPDVPRAPTVVPVPWVLSLVEEPTNAPPRAPVPAPLFAAEAASLKSIEPPLLELSLVEDPPAAPPVLLDRVVAPARIAAPARVAVPTRVATPEPSMKPAPVGKPGLSTQSVPAMKPAQVTKAAPGAKHAPPLKPAPTAKPPVTVESTQTVRALSELELRSDQVSQWFVIQLSLSEQAFDSEAVPNLDIFTAYRLYCVAGIDQGRIVHALRLGFFVEGSAAAAVASYLSAFYDKPTIKRVSSAERDRFADQRFQPRKDVGATGKNAVIEITAERYVREKRNTNI